MGRVASHKFSDGNDEKIKSRMQRNKESAAASRERARLYTQSLELKVAALEETVRFLKRQLAAAGGGDRLLDVPESIARLIDSADESSAIASTVAMSAAPPRLRRAPPATLVPRPPRRAPNPPARLRVGADELGGALHVADAYEQQQDAADLEVLRVRRHRSVSVSAVGCEDVGGGGGGGGMPSSVSSSSPPLSGGSNKRRRVLLDPAATGNSEEEEDLDERSIYELLEAASEVDPSASTAAGSAASRTGTASVSRSPASGSRASSAPVDLQQLLLPPLHPSNNGGRWPGVAPGACAMLTSTTTERRDRDHQSAALVLACGFVAEAVAASAQFMPPAAPVSGTSYGASCGTSAAASSSVHASTRGLGAGLCVV